MRKIALVMAAVLAACFTLTDAQAAKRKHVAASDVAPDPVYEWNLKNMPPSPNGPPDALAPAPAPEKKAMKHHAHHAKKAAKKG